MVDPPPILSAEIMSSRNFRIQNTQKFLWRIDKTDSELKIT